MRKSLLAVAFIAAVAAAAPALAKTISEAEAKRTFFGLDMGGVYQPDGAPWRECIEPSGKTRYWHDGVYDNGKLTISKEGYLCFSYESRNFQDQACFTAERSGKGWKFVSIEDAASVFLATRATKVKACPALDAPSV